MPSTPELLRVARSIHQQLQVQQPLRVLAAQIRRSPWSLQRAFKSWSGESPTAYARRLRLVSVATALLGSDASLLSIARRTGYGSAEVLIRNFRRGFGCTPEQYRRRARTLRRDPLFVRSLARVTRIAPCLTLYQLPANTHRRPATMPMLSAELRTLHPQPALVIRSRIARPEIAATIGQSLGRIVPYAIGAGGALAGQPFARYPEFGVGMLTIEVGMPLVTQIAGSGDIEALELPGGSTAVAVHGGAYDRLPDTFAALERWIASQGKTPSGAPWEVYVTDPADHPDSADWRTEIYWPVR
jgi:AraC-like DNA-binding protein/effector-binding domain-containing protein